MGPPGCGAPRTPLLHLLLLLMVICCPGPAKAFCPFRCLCDENILTVWCDGASLDVVPITLNPGLRELHLSNNRVKSVAASLAVYRHLKFLDMTRNLLSGLGSGSFVEQVELAVLRLGDNRLARLDSGAFDGLAVLKVLRLDGNAISTIEDDAFSPLNHLEILDLSGNYVSSLPARAFNGLENLHQLSLRNNKLSAVPTEAFINVPRLQSLDMGLNVLYVVPEDSFRYLGKLKSIGLDGCGIRVIEDDAFLGLGSISAIHLQDNDLGAVPTAALVRVPHVRDLHLGRNKLQRLRNSDFRGLNSLRTLTVTGEDQLVAVENGTFSDNVQLERLVISHNAALRRLDTGALKGLEALRFLSLRGNGFATFPEDLASWGKLDSFDLRDNPLVCNCSVSWLWGELRNLSRLVAQDEAVTRVQCDSPAVMHGRLVLDIDVLEMGCDGAITLGQIAIACACGVCLLLAGALGLCLYHRHKSEQRRKNGKLAQQLSPEFSPIISHQLGRPPLKYSATADL